MTEQLERQIIELVATDRLEIPISSMSGKFKRKKPKLAKGMDLPKGGYTGNRVYAQVEFEDKLKARGMKDAIADFSTEYPKYGEILNQMIEDKRSVRETHMYFGMNEGCRLTGDDYLGVLTDIGFTEGQARSFYEPLINASRKISKARNEDRSVMVD